MNKKKLCFFWAVIAVAMCSNASGQLQQDIIESKSAAMESANPALAGIKRIYVVVAPAAIEQSGDPEVWGNRQRAIENELRQAGFEIAEGLRLGKGVRQMDIPELRVNTDMIKFADSDMYVFRTQVSLAATVYLEQGVFVKAELWKSEPAMKAVSTENLAAAVTDTVLEQTRSFVHCCITANSVIRPGPTAASLGRAEDKQGRFPGKTTAAKYLYVASKHSRVFHGPKCSSAKRIASKNLTGYNSRDEAVKSGKRPCKRCKP